MHSAILLYKAAFIRSYVLCNSSGRTRVSPVTFTKLESPIHRGTTCRWKCSRMPAPEAGRRRRLQPGRGRTIVDEILQFLAWFEIRNALCRYLDFFPRFGVAPDARVALPHAKTAEAAYFKFVAVL